MKNRENGHVTQRDNRNDDDLGIFHISDILRLEQSKLYRKAEPRLIECNVCHRMSVLINIKKALSTGVKCGNCKAVFDIRILPSGIYKMRSLRGVELVDGTDRRWIKKNF